MSSDQEDINEMIMLSKLNHEYLDNAIAEVLNDSKQIKYYMPIIESLDVSDVKLKSLIKLLSDRKYDKLEKAINKLKH